ncbi:MAG: M55 family metallopeptidase [Anaerolineales bacterium]|nr:M55 family metallopeptidase [Anaerolineales bacterium]
MKILIAVDMEGITGVTLWDHVTPGHAEYARFRKLMTQDVNAAIAGAFEAGAKEVAVADGLWNGSNILVEELDPRARLNSGSPSPFAMMQGIGKDVDGVFFVGYHARQGSANAVLDHTWSSTCVANLWLNDSIAGEYTLNAALAGHFGVPVIMASGDQTACAQITEHLGAVETAVIKTATSRFSAECLAPEVTHKMIRESAARAVSRLMKKDAPKPFVVKTPIKITVQLATSDMADKAMQLPGVTRDDLKLSFAADDMPKAYSAFRALVMLSYPK